MLKINGIPTIVNLDNFGLCPSCFHLPPKEASTCKTCRGHLFIPKLDPDYPDKCYYKTTREGFVTLTEKERKELKGP